MQSGIDGSQSDALCSVRHVICFSSHFMSLINLTHLCLSVMSVCVILHLPVMFRPSVEAASPVSIHPPVPERTTSTFPGSISLVHRDKVMTALWPWESVSHPDSEHLRLPKRETLFMDSLGKKLSPSSSSRHNHHHPFVISLHVFYCAPSWNIPKGTKDLVM